MKKHVLEFHTPSARSALEAAYTRSFIDRTQRPYIRHPAISRPPAASEWALDMRMALANATMLRPIAVAMNEFLSEAGIRQVVGYGYGASFLIGGIVACGDNINGGLLRPQRKAYGFRRTLEGAVRRSHPVIIVDDILSSGRTAVDTASILRCGGYRVAAVHTVFRYGWRMGQERLAQHGLEHRCLATLQKAMEATPNIQTVVAPP